MLRLKYLIPLLIFLFVCVFLFVGLYLDPTKSTRLNSSH